MRTRKYPVRSENTDQTPFAAICQQMHQMANICLNWLRVASTRPLMMVQAESGCMRSTRLARLKAVSHQLTTQSALQIVALPADFDHPAPLGFDHPRWQLLVYSWLDLDTTRHLMAHLAAKTSLRQCTFFRITPSGCERIVTMDKN